MTRRAIDHVAIAIGLFAIACGGSEIGGAKPLAATAGMETEVAAEPAPSTAEPAPLATSEPAPPTSAEPSVSADGTEAPASALEITEPEVTAFADVIVRLAMLEQQGMDRVQAGETPDQVSADLQPQVAEVFEGTAMSAERFNEIAKLAEEDEALRQRIEARLGERLQEQAPA